MKEIIEKIKKKQTLRKLYIDLLYHHQNCERESILQLNLICEKQKTSYNICEKKQHLYNLFVKEISYIHGDRRDCVQ